MMTPDRAEDLSPDRLLALAVVDQAVADLANAKERPEAATFLLEDFWGTWSQWLALRRGPVVSRVHDRNTRRRNPLRRYYTGNKRARLLDPDEVPDVDTDID
jgi:hypothetical protein